MLSTFIEKPKYSILPRIKPLDKKILTWSRIFLSILIIFLVYWILEPSGLLRIWRAALEQQDVEEIFSSEKLLIYENLLLNDLHGDTVLNRWANVPVGNETWKAHYLQSSRRNLGDGMKPILLLVHGYGTTSALAWRSVIGRLTNKYQVYAVDLPGFGRSRASIKFYSTRTGREQALSQICEFMQGFQQAVGIRSPYIVAHSFGGFLMTHCVSRNPSLASRLLLADVPGFFSTNGGFDYGWATFFCFGLPHSIMRPLGRYGRFLIDTILKIVGNELDDAMINYWHQLQMNPEMKGDEIASKFIVHRYAWAVGTGVALGPLLNLSVPVLMVTGALDEISPPHQGEFIHKLAGVPHYIIDGAGHVPYILNQGSDFVSAIDMGERVGKMKSQASRMAACLEHQHDKWAEFICLPSPHLSDRAVNSMYKAIQEISDECMGKNSSRKS